MNRFWEKVDKSGDCWEWTAYKNKAGYGVLGFKTGNKLAHRVSAKLHGMVISGLFVCHHCDNPGCVNPEHLFVGTAKDNAVDMTRKGRNTVKPKKGERSHLSKITRDDVMFIRDNYDALGSRRLSYAVGVSRAQVWRIATGRSWAHV